jgi:hypothetical protein
MFFKDPLKELWLPVWLNFAAVAINLTAVVFSVAYGTSFWWIFNLIAACVSAWFCSKEYAKIPQRKKELQDQLVGYLKRG